MELVHGIEIYLHSTLSRQQSGYGGENKWNNEFDICGTLFFGLIKIMPSMT